MSLPRTEPESTGWEPTWNNLDNPDFRYPSKLEPPSIRLLTILPESTQSTLYCRLTMTSLDNEPDYYHALSYCWGDRSKKELIICDGQQLFIAASQFQALQQFRSRNITTPIWIDAVCINQYDSDEKTSQLALIPSIYRSASSVVVWLGQTSTVEEDTEHTLDGLRKQRVTMWDLDSSAYMARRLRNPAPIVLRALDAMEQRQKTQWMTEPGQEWKDLAWDYAMFQQAWFRRVWVLPEIVSATRADFWIGDSTVSMSDMFQKALNISEKEETDKSAQRTILSSYCFRSLHYTNALYMSQLRGSASDLSMYALLRSTVDYEATERRDKIFALIAMSSDIRRSLANYRFSEDQVVLRLSQEMIKAGLPESISRLGVVVPKPDSRLPSWAADWLRDPVIDDVGEFYRTSSDAAICHVSFDDDQQRLRTKGKLLDTVKHIVEAPAEAFGDAYDFAHNLVVADKLVKFERRCAELTGVKRRAAQRYPTGTVIQGAYWRTFLLNSASLTEFQQPDPKQVTAPIFWRGHMWLLHYKMVVESKITAHKHSLTKYDYSVCYGVGYMGNLASCYLGHFLGSLIESPSIWKLLSLPFVLMWIDSFFSTVGGILEFSWSYVEIFYMSIVYGRADWLLAYACAITNAPTSAGLFQQSLGRARKLKNFCVTERGYFGWCPKATQPGDKLCVLTGSQFPFALRSCGTEWRLLGGCYVSGWMYGQAEHDIDVEETDIVII